MKQHVRQMMAPGTPVKKLDVNHVADPGERVPVGRIKTGERPANRFPTQTGMNVRVPKDVDRIVEI